MVIENRIRELQDSMMDLVAVTAKEGNAESYEDKFREILDEIKSLKNTGTIPDGAKWIDDICKTLEDAPFGMEKLSDSIVRQFIDTIKVVNHKLLLVFMGSFEMEQNM